MVEGVIERLVDIALVLPVTTAFCERRFSSMKLIKTYIGSIIADDRLSNIAVLSVESAIAQYNTIQYNKFYVTYHRN